MDAGEFMAKPDGKEAIPRAANPRDGYSSLISESTTLSGRIESAGDLVIHGRLHGHAIARGKIDISDTGIVEGIVFGEEICIAGRAHGKIQADKALVITRTAEVWGDLNSRELFVEEGARVNRKVHRNAHPIFPSKDLPASDGMEENREDGKPEEGEELPSEKGMKALTEQQEGKQIPKSQRLW